MRFDVKRVKALIELTRENEMSEAQDYLEMSFMSINCFANDGKLDAVELGKFLISRVAMA